MRVVCDTGPLLSATDRRDPAHGLAASLVTALGRDLLVPDPVIGEVDHLMRARLGSDVARLFLQSLAAQAAIDVIRAAGLSKNDIDGLCGSWPGTHELQSALGLPRLTWSGNPMIPIVDHIATAAAAVHAGLCETVLVYHAAYRAAWNTGSALKDPFRRIATPGLTEPQSGPDTMAAGVGYTGWASRYIHEFGVKRDDFGIVALNARANAAR